ncbi:hypothetical protein [Ruegeria arenilitoris]|uniref:hypothetical protein n=1 Tax=Ruegeria arenilitoris TaxID=1173585 RepID=UPI00147CD8E7|nr:hypothetical protein [Ruegeria arenilitoris]
MSLQIDNVTANKLAITKGIRNRKLCLAAIDMVKTVETPYELFCNLAFGDFGNLLDVECQKALSGDTNSWFFAR